MPPLPSVTLEFPWSRPPADRLQAVQSCVPELMLSHEWCSDPYTDAENRTWIAQCWRSWRQLHEFSFAVVEIGIERWLGEVTLDEIDYSEGCANLSYWIRADGRGQGYATRAVSIAASFAFREAELRYLQILCAMDNHASQRVANKLGACRQGLLKAGPQGRQVPARRFILHRGTYAERRMLYSEDLSGFYLQRTARSETSNEEAFSEL